MNEQPKINLPAAGLLLHGLKAEYHRNKLMLKQQRHLTDAGMDIYASDVNHEVTVYGNRAQIKVFTSLGVTPAYGTFGWLTSRSSTAKTLDGASVRAGIIDAGYTGELLVMLEVNPLHVERTLQLIRLACQQEVAIAQIIIMPALVILPQLADQQKLDELRRQGRGDNGFGSTNPRLN